MAYGTLKKLPLALCLTGSLALPALAAERPTEGLAALLAQADFWDARHRPDLARQSLEWAQQVQPDSEEVLYRLAASAAGQGDMSAASQWLEHLRAHHPTSPGIELLTQALTGQPLDAARLQAARQLASQGKVEKAARAYRDLLAGQPPRPQLALEYYQTLAGTERGWNEARQGLQNLARLQPNNPQIRLALARALSYREATRRDAIALYAELDGALPEARREWRQALLWLDAGEADRALFETYAKADPADRQLPAHLEKALAGKRVSPADQARTSGFAALKNGQDAQAQRAFEQALRHDSADADAHGGLGILHLRRAAYAEAAEHLQRAVSLAPAQRAKWAGALADATFYQALQQARGLADLGELAEASAQARALDPVSPAQRRDARLLEADLLLRQERADEAERLYAEVLNEAAGSETAVVGLYAALQTQRKTAQAASLLRQYPELSQARLAEIRTLEALALSQRAEQLSERGEFAKADRLLERASGLAPENPWVRLAQARRLQREEQPERAQALMAQLAQRSDDSEALQAAAVFAADQRRWTDARQLLGQLPASSAPRPELAALAERIDVGLRIDQAVAAMAAGDRPALAVALRELYQRQPSGLDNRGQVALTLAQLGEAEWALTMVRQDLRAHAEADPGALLPHLAVLVSTGQASDASQLMHRMENHGELSAEGRQTLRRLRNGMVVSQADRLREEGRLQHARTLLEQSLADTPEDAALLLARGRLHEATGELDDAAALYRQVLATTPDDAQALQAAVSVALAANQTARAEQLLGQAGDRLDQGTQLYLSARIAEARGEYRTAIALLEDARAALPAAPQRTHHTPAGPLPAELLEHHLNNPRTEARPSPSGVPGLTPSFPGADQTVHLGRDIDRMLVSLQERTASRLQVGAQYRQRSGTEGLSELTEWSAPLRFSMVPGESGRLELTVTPVHLDAGRLSADDAADFGANALLAAPAAGGSQDEAGVGLGIGWSGEQLAADVGTTALGFEQSNLIGGLEWRPTLGQHARLTLGLERRAVSDSLLSYAGAEDPLTGRTWGAVTRNGARLQYAWDDGASGFYAGGAYHLYRGKQVENNRSAGLNAGAYLRPIRGQGRELQTGIALNWMSYDEYQGGFSLGHGGYFSPESFVAVSLPVQYTQQYAPWTLKLQIAPGYQRFDEASADYFPRHRELQAQLEADATRPARYASNSDSGLAFGGGASVEYKMAERAELGLAVGYDSFGDFSERTGLLYLNYRL